jgi:hypothetical protein
MRSFESAQIFDGGGKLALGPELASSQISSAVTSTMIGGTSVANHTCADAQARSLKEERGGAKAITCPSLPRVAGAATGADGESTMRLRALCAVIGWLSLVRPS